MTKKIKIFFSSSNDSEWIEKQVNDFIGSRNIIDIKFSSGIAVDSAKEACFTTDILIIYEE